MQHERFHIGSSFHGSLEPDPIACLRDWQMAATALRVHMTEYSSTDDDQAAERYDFDACTPEREAAFRASDEAPAMHATALSILTDDPPQPEDDYEASIEDNQYRKVSFWLRKVVCDHEGGDE